MIDIGKPYSPISVGPLFREFDQRGEAATIEALTYSIVGRATRVIWPPAGKSAPKAKPNYIP